LGEKISAEFSAKFSPEKMYEKSAPDVLVKKMGRNESQLIFLSNQYIINEVFIALFRLEILK
jgi:hypothetical protein